MYKNNRQPLIFEYIQKHKNVRNTELQEKFGVADMTIRRDLQHLELCGLVVRTHGGVMLPEYAGLFDDKTTSNNSGMKKIRAAAVKAAEFIEDNMSIYADGSKAVLEIIKVLPIVDNLTVFTNSIDTMLELRNRINDISVFVIGGELSKDGNLFDGCISADIASRICVDLCFISCGGIDAGGISDVSLTGVQTKKIILGNSRKKILLADSSKNGVRCTYKLGDWDIIDYIITDNIYGSQENIISAIEKSNVSIIEV